MFSVSDIEGGLLFMTVLHFAMYKEVFYKNSEIFNDSIN
jgi:hypothetical protein